VGDWLQAATLHSSCLILSLNVWSPINFLLLLVGPCLVMFMRGNESVRPSTVCVLFTAYVNDIICKSLVMDVALQGTMLEF